MITLTQPAWYAESIHSCLLNKWMNKYIINQYATKLNLKETSNLRESVWKSLYTTKERSILFMKVPLRHWRFKIRLLQHSFLVQLYYHILLARIWEIMSLLVMSFQFSGPALLHSWARSPVELQIREPGRQRFFGAGLAAHSEAMGTCQTFSFHWVVFICS